MLHLKREFVWCRKLETYESISEIARKISKLVRRRIEKISRADRVRNEEILRRVEEEKNVLHTEKRGNANWFGHLLSRICRSCKNISHITKFLQSRVR